MAKKKKKQKYLGTYDIETGRLTLPKKQTQTVKKTASKNNTQNKRTWFNKGLFADGYDFGDITKTILATNADIKKNFTTGVAKIGEGAIDAGAQLVVGGAKLLGKDKLAQQTKDFIAQDLVSKYSLEKRLESQFNVALKNVPGMGMFAGATSAQEVTNNIINGKKNTQKRSLLGDKSDSLVQSAGLLGGTAALQAVGVPWWLTIGTSSFGSGVEEAYKGGATFGEATAYGAINAGSEVLLERLSGGIKFKGMNTLDEGLKKKLAETITNRTAKTLGKFGFDMAGEGTEEVLQETVSNIGKKLTYEDEKTWNEILASPEAMDGYLESFIGGAVLGGGFNSMRLGNSLKTGRDYDTGLTSNEQTVLSKEVEKRANEKKKKAALNAEVEKRINETEERNQWILDENGRQAIKNQVQEKLDNGEIDYSTTTLSKKEIKAIEEEVTNDLKKGYISVNAIEETLTPEATKKLQKLEAELKTEVDPTKKELIQKDIAEISKARASELSGIIGKDAFLQESYRQENLSKEAFSRKATAEDTEVTQALEASAKAAGLSNTRKAHETFDIINNIANDTGVQYAFTSNEQLKEMQSLKQLPEDIDVTNINGFYRVTDKNGNGKVLINVDSKKAIDTVIGHETTHLFEGSKEYKALQQIAFDYAKTIGEYDTRLKDIQKIYKGRNANVENELTSDLVGDYLFSNEQFVRELSAKQPNVFKRIYEYISNAVKKATAGSKEERQLLEFKQKYKKLYREISKATTKESKTNSLTEADSNTPDDNNIVYSLSDNLRADLQAVLDNTFPKNEQIYIGETSQFLVDELGAKPIKVTMNPHKAYKNMVDAETAREENRHDGDSDIHYHDLGVDGLIDALSASENPIIAFENFAAEGRKKNGRENRIVLITEAKTDKNEYIVVTMEVNAKARLNNKRIEANKVVTAFGRDYVQGLIHKAVGENKIMYADKKRSHLVSGGTDLMWFSGRNYDFKDNIQKFWDNVNYLQNKRPVMTSTETSEIGTNMAEAFAKAERDRSQTKFSLSDNKGRKLSEGQQEYFKDSKVRDENGSLKVMYHGTPSGNFTVFKDGTYFTPNEQYAERYQSPSASSISTGKVADNPKTYEVYLDIKKPFDINEPEARRIYIEDYIKGGNAMGINPYESDAYYNNINSIDWTEGEDLRDFLIEEGYDYDGLVLDEGADGGYGDAVQYRGSSYVVFSPEQIKSVDNLNPTDNPDIRFSLSSPVEETRKMVAWHNMSLEGLEAAVSIGGLAMPSFAVKPEGNPHLSYGNVSIVARKEDVEPSKNTRIFGGDAWTPDVGDLSINYKINSKELERVERTVRELTGDVDLGYLALDENNAEDKFNRWRGNVYQAYGDTTGLRYAYLKNKGIDVELPTREKSLTSGIDNEGIKYAAEHLFPATINGVDEIERAYISGTTYFNEHPEEVDAVRGVINDYYGIKYGSPFDEKEFYSKEKFGFAKWDSVIRGLQKYRTQGVETEVDSAAAKDVINEKINEEGYKKWLKDLFDGVVEKAGIRNEKDLFTPSGNRRSFDSLHWDYNLANIVKALKGKDQQGKTNFLSGPASAKGAALKDFKSIEDVRKSLDRIVPEEKKEETKEAYDAFTDRVKELASIVNPNDMFDGANDIAEILARNKTKSGILRYLSREFEPYYHYDNIDLLASDLYELIDLANKLPMEYFEAKLYRAYTFDEPAGIVVPDNIDENLFNKLTKLNGNVLKYEAGNDVDRVEKVNSIEDSKFSLGAPNPDIAPYGRIWSRDIKRNVNENTDNVNTNVDVTAPVKETAKEPVTEVAQVKESPINRTEDYIGTRPLTEEDLPYIEQANKEAFANLPEEPLQEYETTMPEDEVQYAAPVESPLENEGRDMKNVGNRKVKAYMYENPEVKPFFQEEAGYMLADLNNSIKGERFYNDELYYISNGEQGFFGTKRYTSPEIAYLLDNYNYTYDDIEKGLNAIIEDHGAENIAIAKRIEFLLDERLREGYTDIMYGDEYPPNQDYINLLREKEITEYSDEAFNSFGWEELLKTVPEEDIAPVRTMTEGSVDYITNLMKDKGVKEADLLNQYGVKSLYDLTKKQFMEAVDNLNDDIAPYKGQLQYNTETGTVENNPADKPKNVRKELIDKEYKTIAEEAPEEGTQQRFNTETGQIEDVQEDVATRTRKEIRKALVEDNRSFLSRAMDKAKNIPMALMNNTDTIRVTELVFGREAANKINKLIFQKAIDNEARSIAWQNKQRKIVKDLGIKARSKMSAAIQKFGEKEYMNEAGEVVKYDEAALKAEFPDVGDQAKIRKAAFVIRELYDNYIDRANVVLTDLGFEPIKKRNDYMRHFSELTDVFSRYGIPFNPKNMQEHLLPTDINGITDTFSPQKNFFANMQPRKGIRTNLDAITGIDGYIGGIANLIWHTEDIQRGRAFEELIRETYGQEKGVENAETIEQLTDEELLRRIEQIQNNHLSNYAAWVHEWTNGIAGKKNKVDRSIESMFGRKAFSFVDEVRKQVGANMIGLNLASSLTNLIAPVQALSKTEKMAFAKGTVDTFKNIFANDGFVDKNAFLTSRFGTDLVSKTAWDKARDVAYVFMKGVDHFSANLIVRSKYHELRSKGMSDKQAHSEAGKFAARIMGDRTKGANALLFDSKLLGLVTQFQLEVNNQLYAMFYDTYHESKEQANGNAAKTAAKMTFTLGQLTVFTHLFGKAFESLAGYNPTFDIIGIIATALGIGDDDEDKTQGERLEAAMLQFLKALPYTSTFTGGRIPIGQAFPVEQLITGKDDYNNDKSRLETLKETLPYYLLPGGYGQIKKTTQGLGMFSPDNPVPGSYTDSGNLRFPVEKTPQNIVKAAIFGQWASKEARDYFDNERLPLKDKQIQEFKDLNIPIQEYWDIREDLQKQKTLEDKFDYVSGLDLPVKKKNILINNVVNRKEKVNMSNYDSFGSLEEFDFANKYPKKYKFLQNNGISWKEYNSSEEARDAYNWAYKNKEGFAVAKAVTGDVISYKEIASEIYDIKADKDSSGKSISGSRKAKIIDYINNLDIPYESKLILFKKEYNSDDYSNVEIIDYVSNREDLSYTDKKRVLTGIGFEVDNNGTVRW